LGSFGRVDDEDSNRTGCTMMREKICRYI
jgi:hypothetical protein